MSFLTELTNKYNKHVGHKTSEFLKEVIRFWVVHLIDEAMYSRNTRTDEVVDKINKVVNSLDDITNKEEELIKNIIKEELSSTARFKQIPKIIPDDANIRRVVSPRVYDLTSDSLNVDQINREYICKLIGKVEDEVYER